MAVTDQMVCFSLYTATRMTTRAYRTLLEPWGLTYPQYLVLVLLWTDGDRTVGQLGEELDLDSGTLSPLLRRMEAAGLITRTRSPQDERVVTVALTERGSELRADLAHIPACIARGTGLPDVDAARALITTLQRLTDEMRDVTPPAQPV